MPDHVYVVEKSEMDDFSVIGVREEREDALELLRSTADGHRYDGHWDWYKSEEDDEMVGTMKMKDVTLRVSKQELL